MHIKNWIHDFLNERGESGFTGEPVYQYKITDEEFSELKVALELDLDELCDIESYSFAIGIVLYCCEWWRREYEGSNWSWKPIFESLGARTPKPALRNEIVEKGLKRIKRPILKSQSGDNEYLGTIAFESGIPRTLLVDDHYFTKVISDSYLQFLELSSYELSDLEIIKRICEARRLPNAFQNEYFYELIKKVVDDLINLNNRFDLRRLENPVEFLNQEYPDWDYYFPIAPDSDSAINFINKLLSDTSKKRDIAPLSKLRVSCRLVQIENLYYIHQVLNLKEGIIDCSLLGITLDEWMGLSDVLELYVGYGGQKRRLLGSLYKLSKEGKFSSPGFKNLILSRSILEMPELILEDPFTLKSVELRVDCPTLRDNENPIFFRKDNDFWELKSIGSSNLKEGVYRVLIPSEYRLSKYLSKLEFAENGVGLFEFNEPGSISNGINHFKITFSLSGEEIRYHVLPASSSTIPYFPNKNKHIYLGMPRIFQLNSEGILLERVRNGLEYLNESGEWRKVADNVFGELKIRKKDQNGVTLFNMTLSVLPSDFRVEFVPSRNNAKVILIGTSQFKKVIITPIETSINEDSIEFMGVNEPNEEYFNIKLYSVSSISPVSIQLPVPKDLSSFRSENGDLISESSNMFLGGLLGKRFLTNNLSSKIKRSKMTLSLYDPNVSKPINSKFYFDIEPFGTYEIPLINLRGRIRTLFSLTDNNDSFIRISYERCSLIVRQFDSKPYFTDDGIKFRMPIESASAFRLDLPFTNSPGGIVSLPISEEGLLNQVPSKEGLWFIYPHKNSENFFCPVVFKKVNNEMLPEHFDSIYSSSRIPDFYERQSSLIDHLNCLAKDCGNNQWNELRELFNETEHLPLSTLDIWKAAAKSNFVIATMFFIMPEKFLQRFTEEFSILWRAIKVSDWELAFGNFQGYIKSFGIDDEVVKDIIERKLEVLNSMLRLVTTSSLLKNEVQPFSFGIYCHIINEELNGSHGNKGLRSRKADQEWPDYLNDDVKIWLRLLPKEFEDTFLHVSTHQKAVVFLPVVLANLSVDNTLQIEDLKDIHIRFLIDQIKQFDPEWFEKVFDYTQAYLLSKKIYNG